MNPIETPSPPPVVTEPAATESQVSTTAPTPTLRSDRATDAKNPENIDAFFPEAKITDYEVPRLTSGSEQYGPEHTAFDMKLRTWVHHAGFTKGTGSFVLKEILETGERTNAMSPADQELWARSEKQKLEKLWGENYEAMVQRAQRLALVLDHDHPGFLELLEKTRAGDSAHVIAQFAMQAEVLMNKSDLRKKESGK